MKHKLFSILVALCALAGTPTTAKAWSGNGSTIHDLRLEGNFEDEYLFGYLTDATLSGCYFACGTVPDTYTTAEAVATTLAAAPQSTDGAVSFTGSYSPVSLAAGDQTVLYLGAANTLYWPSAAKTVGACRALFRLGGDAVAHARAFNLNFGDDDETTGIVNTSMAGSFGR